jgi:hypothetical protein
MNIGDYVAIYAALVATAVLIWIIWQNRKYLKFDEIISGEGNGVIIEVYLTNKTKRPVNIRQLCFLDEDGSLYNFACKVSSFWKNEPITIGDEHQRTITMENEGRYVFLIKIRQIKLEFDESSRYLFSHVAVVDDAGRTYKHRIPPEIRNQLRD